MRYPTSRFFCFLPLAFFSSASLAQDAPSNGGIDWATISQVFVLLLPVLAVFAGSYFYLRHLHRIFHQSCVDRFKLDVFAKSPMGLPEGTIGAMLGFIAGVLLLYLIVAVVIKVSVAGFTLSLAGIDKNMMAGISAIVFLVLIIVGAIFYMQRLQTRFFEGCVSTNQIQKFFEAPAGLPDGTVRAVLALMIVAVSLFFIVFQFFFSNGSKDLPQGLMTLLTAVVAFYFANRASAQGSAESVTRQTQGLREQRDTAIKREQQTKADGLIGKVQKALQVTQAASVFLPPELREKYDKLAEKLQTGLSTAEGLTKRDDSAAAVDLMAGALGEFGRTNPAFQAVAKALPVFTRVLGVGVPALGLITTVVGIGVRIGTARHERWKLRILQAPITAASMPIQPIDGLMAQRLFRANPDLARAFATELDASDDAFIAEAANEFVNLDTGVLWAKQQYRFDGGKERFDSQEEFENTIQVLRRLLSDDQIRPYVKPEWLGPINNYETLVGAVDKLHEDKEAQARLDELMVVTDGLMGEGQPVLKIMEKIEEELKREGSSGT